MVKIIPQQPKPIDSPDQYLANNDYCIQEKYDGRHVLFNIINGIVTAYNKRGEIATVPAEIFAKISAIKDATIDGELMGSRYVAYDLLAYNGTDMRQIPYKERHRALSKLNIETAPMFCNGARREKMNSLKINGGEGIVLKRLDAPHSATRSTDMMKYKFYATASVIVSGHNAGKQSVSIRLYDNTSIGNVAIPANANTPPVGAIIEIRYLYAIRGGSLIQPVYLFMRDDVSPDECTAEQIKYRGEKFIDQKKTPAKPADDESDDYTGTATWESPDYDAKNRPGIYLKHFENHTVLGINIPEFIENYGK